MPSPLQVQSCRLLRKRCGVCINAIKRAVRIGPMQGIWCSSFEALCFRLSANNSGRRFRATSAIHPTADRVARLAGETTDLLNRDLNQGDRLFEEKDVAQ